MYKFSTKFNPIESFGVIVTYKNISCLVKRTQKTQTLVQETPNFIGIAVHIQLNKNKKKAPLSFLFTYWH